MFSGARLVVTTRRSRAVTSRKATREATASTTCSQLSSTSRVGAGVELLRDPAADVGALRRGVRTTRGDRVAHAEGGTDLGDDVVGRGDADQLDEVHPRLGRLAGEHVRDPGLADAAGPDDRGQPAAADRRPQPRQVGLATEQLLGVVPDPGADRLVGRQQLAVQPLQRVGRVHAEPVAQAGAVVLVARQRHRHPRDDRLRAQQRLEHLGVVGGRPRAPGAGARAPRARVRCGPGRARAAAARPVAVRRARARTSASGPSASSSSTAVSSSASRASLRRLRRDRRRPARGAARCSSRPSSSASTSSWPDAEPVAVAVPDQHVGPALRAHPRDQHLQRLGRVGRPLVAPDHVDQRRVGHPGRRQRERGQQGSRPLPRERSALPAHVVEEAQGRSHGASLGACVTVQAATRGRYRMGLAGNPAAGRAMLCPSGPRFPRTPGEIRGHYPSARGCAAAYTSRRLSTVTSV